MKNTFFIFILHFFVVVCIKANDLKLSTSINNIAVKIDTTNYKFNTIDTVKIKHNIAHGVVKKAINSIKENYSQKEYLSKEYRRSILSEKDSVLFMQENIVNNIKSYNFSKKNKYFLVDSRYFNFHKDKSPIKNIGEVDVIKKIPKILKNKDNNYHLAYNGKTIIEGEAVYIIEFKNDELKGYLYINKNDFAFVKIDIQWEDSDRTIANYKKINDKYYFSDGVGTRINSHKDFARTTVSNIIVLDIDTNLDKLQVEGLPIKGTDIISEYPTIKKDTLFWENYSKLLPYDSLNLKEKINKTEYFHTSTTNDKKDIKNLYNRSLKIMLSTDFHKDFHTLNSNIISANLLINNTIDEITNKKYLNLILKSTLLAINKPFENALTEKLFLSSVNIPSKTNMTFINPYKESYVYGNQGNTEIFKSIKYSDFMRLHTIRNDANYIKGLMLEEYTHRNNLSNKNNLNQYISLFLGDILYYKFYNSFLLDRKDFNEISRGSKQPIIINRGTSWAYYLHNPEKTYHSLITHQDLSEEASLFLKKSNLKSLLNIVSTYGFKLKITEFFKFSTSLNYLRIPYGEMFSQYFLIENKTNLHGIFMKQYRNKNKTGLGIGYKMYDKKIKDNIKLTTSIDFWNQPKYQIYNSREFQTGFHIGQILDYTINNNRKDKTISISIGYDYKTNGYMPESYFFENRFDIKTGININF